MKQKTILVVLALTVHFCISAKGYVLERRGVEVDYDYRQASDGFGNIRTVEFAGRIKNITQQDISRAQVNFKLVWKNQNPTTHKLRFKNIPPGESHEFAFNVDLGNRTDILVNVAVAISKVKFSTLRKVSPPTQHDIITHKYYSLPEITDEGRKFAQIVENLKQSQPFKIPVKDEFETTNEYETRINYLENQHFTRLMDALEENYGSHMGGRHAIVRFLPKHRANEFVYVSENSFFFRIPVRLGRYNADKERFEDVNFSPRTILFPPQAYVPDAGIELAHRNNMFFLNSSHIEVTRNEARKWRENEQYLVLEVALRMGVVQEGSYPEPLCLVERIAFINTKTSEIYRQWE
ncbi:hypothetical protein JXA40_02810 [bacterium]|nr:hypothetical protein [candidate division CSSED10-310 bacterium]